MLTVFPIGDRLGGPPHASPAGDRVRPPSAGTEALLRFTPAERGNLRARAVPRARDGSGCCSFLSVPAHWHHQGDPRPHTCLPAQGWGCFASRWGSRRGQGELSVLIQPKPEEAPVGPDVSTRPPQRLCLSSPWQRHSGLELVPVSGTSFLPQSAEAKLGFVSVRDRGPERLASFCYCTRPQKW